MSHLFDVADERADSGEECTELGAAAEPLEVAHRRVPLDAQDVPRGLLGAARQLPPEAVGDTNSAAWARS